MRGRRIAIKSTFLSRDRPSYLLILSCLANTSRHRVRLRQMLQCKRQKRLLWHVCSRAQAPRTEKGWIYYQYRLRGCDEAEAGVGVV